MTTYNAALLQTVLAQAVPSGLPANVQTAIGTCADAILNALEAADAGGVPGVLLSALLDAEKFIIWSSVEDIVKATTTALPAGPLDATESSLQAQLAAAQATLDSLQNSVRLYEAAKATAAAAAPTAPTPPVATTPAPPAPSSN